MKTNKFEYLWIVQGYYGSQYGYEDLTASENLKDAKQTLKEYRNNESYLFRLIQRRVLNETKN